MITAHQPLRAGAHIMKLSSYPREAPLGPTQTTSGRRRRGSSRRYKPGRLQKSFSPWLSSPWRWASRCSRGPACCLWRFWASGLYTAPVGFSVWSFARFWSLSNRSKCSVWPRGWCIWSGWSMWCTPWLPTASRNPPSSRRLPIRPSRPPAARRWTSAGRWTAGSGSRRRWHRNGLFSGAGNGEADKWRGTCPQTSEPACRWTRTSRPPVGISPACTRCPGRRSGKWCPR